MGQKLQDATATSFTTLGHGLARDKFNQFYYGQKVDGFPSPMRWF